jgi:hypothetical protein
MPVRCEVEQQRARDQARGVVRPGAPVDEQADSHPGGECRRGLPAHHQHADDQQGEGQLHES